ncbi:hypothetical protein B0T26DRAFT_193063 [Lasiosphaeria miniovina]|uniref:Uncharacterized protein n=1 Tax=Lasiosphaeria miniovina TaxID=1954250 RepID=A0AA40DZ23_9PEZI|nr:uncharacterized protein B0T26DRAFT_193063 [Lasiosphaeria miniovina]KAK0721804.1 hypothetical protein B0T26DRAFT_193063 [Lasiosphaeria miniovina]
MDFLYQDRQDAQCCAHTQGTKGGQERGSKDWAGRNNPRERGESETDFGLTPIYRRPSCCLILPSGLDNSKTRLRSTQRQGVEVESLPNPRVSFTLAGLDFPSWLTWLTYGVQKYGLVRNIVLSFIDKWVVFVTKYPQRWLGLLRSPYVPILCYLRCSRRQGGWREVIGWLVQPAELQGSESRGCLQQSVSGSRGILCQSPRNMSSPRR